MRPDVHFLPPDGSQSTVHEQWLSAPYARSHDLMARKLLPAAVVGMGWRRGQAERQHCACLDGCVVLHAHFFFLRCCVIKTEGI
jgi:hypothetical protein